MKKLSFLTVAIICIAFFVNCGSSKKALKAAVPKVTYEGNIMALVSSNCSPCHIPAKGGNKRPYDTYAGITTDIDEIIRRIDLHPGERGFMPFRKTRLSDSTIAVFKQWKTDGLLDK